MQRKLKWSWEKLDVQTERAKVRGGWLVVHHQFSGKGQIGESMTFVPDNDHEWTIIKEEIIKDEKKEYIDGY